MRVNIIGLAVDQLFANRDCFFISPRLLTGNAQVAEGTRKRNWSKCYSLFENGNGFLGSSGDLKKKTKDVLCHDRIRRQFDRTFSLGNGLLVVLVLQGQESKNSVHHFFGVV